MNPSPFEVIASFVVFANLLIVFLAWQKQSIRCFVLFLALYAWFCLVMVFLSVFLDALPLAKDGMRYFQDARAIAESGFHEKVISTHLVGKVTSIGPDVFTLVQAAIIYLTMPNFVFLLFGQVWVATLAVFYAVRFGTLALGPNAQKYIIFAFIIYFSWYWWALQNLREAPLVLFMGIALVYYMLWWAHERTRDILFAFIAATCAVLFREENLLLLLAIVGLTLLVKYRSIAKRFATMFVALPPLLYAAIALGIRLRYGNPLRSINSARMARAEGGYYLDMAKSPVTSLEDLFYQLPETFRFFLMSVWPWDIGAGLIYTRAYAHSLSALLLLSMAVIGLLKLRHALRDGSGSATPLWILLTGFTLVAMIYSVIDVSAGSASRHSLFYFYFLLSSFVPVGFWYVRQKSARLIKQTTHLDYRT